MTQEEKQILLKDLCARLPYEVAIIPDGQTTPYRVIDIDFNKEFVTVKTKDRELIGVGCLGFEDFKLILRPMSSMTEEEEWKYNYIKENHTNWEAYDYLNSIHIDYRGLISMGLAISTPEGMYDIKTE